MNVANTGDRYERSLSSMLCKFPSQKISNIIDEHAGELESAEKDAWFLLTTPLSSVIQRYRSGLKGTPRSYHPTPITSPVGPTFYIL